MVPRFTPEWRLLDPRVDLEALRLYLNTVEQQIAFLHDLWNVRLNADLNNSTNRDDSDWLRFKYDMREAQVTKSLRGGFIISLWASYESSVSEVANLVRKEKGLSTEKFPDARGDTWVDRAKAHFDSVLEFPLHPDLDDWNSLHVLYAVRNAYAHANGRFRLMKKSVQETLIPVIEAGASMTYEWDGLRVDGPYVHRSYDLVDQLLKDLIRRALKWADDESA